MGATIINTNSLKLRLRTIFFGLAFMTLVPSICASNALAEGEHPDIFHAFIAEADLGEGKEETIGRWDLDGWYGGDYHKLWLKSEGEIANSTFEQSEFWALYSRNIAEFWDGQAGLRFDTEPESSGYLVAGIQGLAPYLFETELHLFLSEEADVSLRLHQENELLLTQRLVLEPYLELNLFAQDVKSQEVGEGLSDGEFGIQLRYEVTRKFAPYLDLRYEATFGETADMLRDAGERRDDWIAAVGLRLMF